MATMAATNGPRPSVEELEAQLGAQVKRLRVLRNITQANLARSAGISVGALKNLESGAGATVATLVAAVRQLEQTEWLERLQPRVSISPMQMLRSKKERVRASRSRGPDVSH